jgi:hypothetical protein
VNAKIARAHVVAKIPVYAHAPIVTAHVTVVKKKNNPIIFTQIYRVRPVYLYLHSLLWANDLR